MELNILWAMCIRFGFLFYPQPQGVRVFLFFLR